MQDVARNRLSLMVSSQMPGTFGNRFSVLHSPGRMAALQRLESSSRASNDSLFSIGEPEEELEDELEDETEEEPEEESDEEIRSEELKLDIPSDPVEAASWIDKQLGDAMENQDTKLLIALLKVSQDIPPTRTMYVAHKTLGKLLKLDQLADDMTRAIDEVDLGTLKILLGSALKLGLERPELIQEARRMVYGMTKEEKTMLRLQKALETKNLSLLSVLLTDADKLGIQNNTVAAARKLLYKESGVESSAFTASDEQDVALRQIRQSYDNFIGLAGKFPLDRCRRLRPKGNYAKHQYFKKKAIISDMLTWQDKDLLRSLVHLSTAYCGGDKKKSKQLKAKAKHVFKNIRGFMGDVFHPYPATLGFEVLKIGCECPLLRDEIYMQLIKQTSNNPEVVSVVHALQLLYLCLSTFAPSNDLRMFLFSHLATFARSSYPLVPIGFSREDDLATNCWVGFQLLSVSVANGAHAPIPELSDVDLLYQGKFAAISLAGVKEPTAPPPPPPDDGYGVAPPPPPPPPDD